MHQYFIDADYDDAIALCEDIISLEPDTKLSYWYLGLIFLLQGQEVDAQMTWAMALSDLEDHDEQR